MASLCNIRCAVICLIAFAAFRRFDELAKLFRLNVDIKSDMLKLIIKSSKTDQYRDGAWIVHVIGQSNLPCSFDEPIFRKGEASPSQPSFLSIRRRLSMVISLGLKV